MSAADEEFMIAFQVTAEQCETLRQALFALYTRSNLVDEIQRADALLREWPTAEEVALMVEDARQRGAQSELRAIELNKKVRDDGSPGIGIEVDPHGLE